MPYWRLFYHIVWSTHRREPLIDDVTERLLQRALRTTCHELKINVHAIGTMPDHVHLAVSIPPTVAVTDAIARLKGSASHFVNRSTQREGRFSWQTEYGVLSFGEKNLPNVVDYVQNQPARHANNTLWSPLEPTKDARSSQP